ncbi:MAG: glycosyltransferase family 2 protein [bacterium]|nr:glycosyltransferase family 2 protein [bacterium]
MLKKRRLKVVAVMPAYNAAKTLKKTYLDIPKGVVDKVLVVDDGSRDETVRVAKKLGLEVVVHPQNRGYGGNQKTCYTLALSQGADIIVMIHPDYQYDSTLTDELINPILKGRFNVMLGSRISTRKEVLAGGMPLYKYISNRFLTFAENLVLGQNLSEYHTGFRAYTKEVLGKLPFHKYSDDFVFDQQILIGAIAQGAKIGEISVPVRYFPEASSANFRRSLVYGLSILRELLLYILFGKHHFLD